MRRLSAALALLVATSTFAASESAPREIERGANRGRAVIVSPVKDLTDWDRAQLAEEGLVIRRALSGGRYLARLAANANVATDERIRTIEPLTAEKKIHPTALRAAVSGKSYADVHVLFHEDVDLDAARNAILAAGGAMDIFTLDFLPMQRIDARIPSHALTALASNDEVLTIVGQRKYKVATENSLSATLSKVDLVQAAPYGLSGEGITVSLFELGAAQATHPEFGGRLNIAATTAGGSTSDRRHATHVSGTIGAAGVKPQAKGMAPKATIHQFCVEYDGNNCTEDWLDLKEDQLAPLNVTADNNSWGFVWGWWEGDLPVWSGTDIYWGAYDLILASPIDKISNDTGILFVHSSGNDALPPIEVRNDAWKHHHHVDDDFEEIKGQVHCVSQNGSGTDCPVSCNATADRCEMTLHHAALDPFDTLGTTAAAKNVIAVGAVDQNLAIASFSSRGPAKDGRVKPDVVARGVSVHSSVPTDTYANASGTSMAAPAVTGISALLAEQWKRTYGTKPTAAALKALIIAGTEDLGNPGPDYTFGFGLVNAKSSVDLILADAGQKQRIRTLTFAQGQQQQHEMNLVVTETQNLRVVLNWPDPYIPFLGGNDVADKALINNLDLRVIDPSGNTVLPWILNKDDRQANATKGVNTVDNVEVVDIPNAAPGVYRVIATGTSVPQGTQSAVFVANARTARPCVDVQEKGNDSEGSAYGNLVAGQLVSGGLCSATDVDFYRFNVTKTGPVAVTITTGDTALKATLTGTGISRTQVIPANSTATLNADANTVPNLVILKIEKDGSLGVEPQYSFVPTFSETRQPKRRSVRR